MKIHEYQAKKLLQQYGVKILKGILVDSASEASNAATVLGQGPWVVKAQIHAGGRGKGGGVKVVKTLDDLKMQAERILSSPLITPQTPSQGQTVHQLYIEEGCRIKKELYVSLMVDRQSGRIMVLASSEGGMDIEEVAERLPEKIVKQHIDPAIGCYPYFARNIAFGMGLKGVEALKVAAIICSLYKAFTALDASLIEINPLVITEQGDVIALDAKIDFDDNALMRHPEVEELRDPREEDPQELEAAGHSLNYIKLDGNIGCMVNGAGLAMATMDAIKLYGGDPANFLDVGGGAPKDRVIAAFKLILSDQNVQGILVNIFGGIMRCDIIAEGIVAAVKEMGIQVPLVVRLEGTNGDLGKQILAQSALKIISADDLGDAGMKIVRAVKEAC